MPLRIEPFMIARPLIACLIIHGLELGPAWAPALSAEDPVSQEGKTSSGLISDLGSESWSQREDAQEKILREGIRIAPLLEAAARSENIELAYRARYLLTRIDPQLTEFQIAKVDTRAKAVVELSTAAGVAGQALTAQSTADPSAASYSIEFRTMDPVPDRIEIWITQTSPGPNGMEVRREARSPADIILMKRSEECLYRRLGLEIERERRAYVTLARVRTGRRSLLETRPFGSTRDAVLAEFVEDLRKQAATTDREARATAIDLLGELGEAGSIQGALDDPDTRAIAALARGSPDLLAEVMNPSGRDRSALAVRAAAKLVESGDEKALHFLVERLVEGDPAHLHLVMASLADRAVKAPLPADVRTRLVETALSDDVLGRAPWEDVETEYFFSALARLLQPDVPVDVDIARAALERLERLARGELGPVQVRMRVAIDLWRRIARRLPGSAGMERAMVLRILPALSDAPSVNEALTFLEESLPGSMAPPSEGASPGPGGEATADDLPLLLDAITTGIEGGDPSIASACFQSLLRIARTLPAARGQLRPLAAALIRACEAASRAQGADEGPRPSGFISNHVRQAEEILSGWTSIPVPPPDRSAGKAAPARRSFNAAPWKAWMEDGARVAAREEEILSGRGRGETGPGPVDLVYFEFDLLLEGEGIPGRGEGPAFEVLDARRLEVTSSRPITYEDRWGNRMRLRIDEEGTRQVPDRPTRFRLNSRPSLFVGLPVLSSVQGRVLSASWHETSDAFFGSFAIQRPGVPAYRTLSYLAHRDASPPPPDVRDARGLWQWFLEHHLLELPDDAPAQHVNAVLGVVRALRIKECRPLLRKLFERGPTPELARHLQEVGDPSGVEYLRKEIESGREDSRVRAALILCELGFDDGARILIEPARRQLVRRMHYQVISSLEAYLKSPRALPELREEILDFLFAVLDDPVFQPRAFVLIQREVGLDFGFTAARGMDDQEKRKAALEEAVKSAREWRAAHGAKRF